MNKTKFPAPPPRAITIRDTVHGDINLGPVEHAVIDTRIFQRLRYIRQNGLLHFVFPGAVHTRFAHSIGTMHVASKAAHSVIGGLYAPERKHDLDYLQLVLRLAALLHDVGHCAFSHSIEHIQYKGKPLLGTTQSLFTSWDERSLLDEYVAAHAEDAHVESAVTHEQIGLILVRRIFDMPGVSAACAAIEEKAEDVGQDVRAIMDGSLRTTPRFAAAATTLASALEPTATDSCRDLQHILHSIISSTFDVDRLDYLVRDSVHCGVAYGMCQVDLLVNNLCLGVVGGNIVLLLRRKAAHALDDMLWSRYQLYLQVYNHKTNAGFNATLERALRSAFNDKRIDPPSKFEDFIGFIDDYVIGQLFNVATHLYDDEPVKRHHIETLVDRRVPVHLGKLRVVNTSNLETDLTTEKARLAKDHGISPDDIMHWEAKSHLIKGGLFPLLVEYDHEGRWRDDPVPFATDSTIVKGSIEHVYHVVHFFTDRRDEL